MPAVAVSRDAPGTHHLRTAGQSAVHAAGQPEFLRHRNDGPV